MYLIAQFTKLKQTLEYDVLKLKEQLERDERIRVELQHQRDQIEKRKKDLQQQHKDEVWYSFVLVGN